MTRRKGGKRRTLSTGIYADRFGISIVVKGREKGRRYPLGTPLAELRATRRDLLRADEDAPRAARGSLDAYFDDYIKTLPSATRWAGDGTVREHRRRRDERALWRHWQAAGLGRRSADSVTPLEIKQHLRAWEQQFAKATLKHLRRLLGAVYTAVNGKSGFNPVRDVSAITVRYEEPRGVPYELIELIFAQIPNLGAAIKGCGKKDGGPGRSSVNKAKIRLRVEAYTSLPPAQLKRILPRDVHLPKKELLARPRRKGTGTEAKRLPLTDQGVHAMRAFVAAQCFGAFNTRSVARTWRRAVIKTRRQWEQAQAKLRRPVPWPLPDNVRPYDLRHSFATMVLEETGSIQAVADMLMHASLETSRRYALAAVDPQLRKAAALLSKRLPRGTVHGTDERRL